MMQRGFVAVAAIGAVCLASGSSARAQAGGFSDVKPEHWAADSIVALSSRGILAPQAKPAGKAASYDGSKTVTRYELAVALYRFVQYIEAADRQKKGKTRALAAPADGKTAVARLIADGYLPKDTPLATNGNKPVTAEQLSEAMASVLVRNREKVTPMSPDSIRAQPIDRPGKN